VAIACQGGGSHTAFTAGVLQSLLQAKMDGADFEIVALTGTSGGAICALLAWHGLITGNCAGAIAQLQTFWTAA
jgi:NTE family protein